MLFDWFTFFAQLVNFLVLVWLLKRFLYKPILKAVSEREKHIALQIHDAETLKKRANTELESFRNKNAEFDLQKQNLVEMARLEIDSERKKLQELTRTEIENLRLQWLESLKNEQKSLNAELTDLTKAGVFSIARKTLSELAAKNLEEQITEVFINRIKMLDATEKSLLISEITKAQGKFIIRSVFEIQAIHQKAIKSFFEKEIAESANPLFDNTPFLISGIELVAGGYKMVWSIDNYLEELENSFDELLSAKT